METRARQTARYRHPRRPRCRRRHRRCRRSPPHFAVWNGGLPHGRPLQLPPHGVTTRRGGGGNDPDGDGGGRTSSHPGGASRPRCPPHESGRGSMIVVPAGAGGLLVGCGSTPAAVRPLTLRARKRGGQCHWLPRPPSWPVRGPLGSHRAVTARRRGILAAAPSPSSPPPPPPPSCSGMQLTEQTLSA